MIAKDGKEACPVLYLQSLAKRFLNKFFCGCTFFLGRIRDGRSDPSLCAGIAIVEDHKRTFLFISVRVGKNVFIDAPVRCKKIIEKEMFHACEKPSLVEKREY